jgi:HAE1 family hydrophobic/amphiphilic exporter-1
MPIAHFAVNRRVAVTMIALAIVVLGIFAIPRLSVALLPSFTQPVVSVSVSYTNVGPEQMESLITRPIENAVSRVNGLQQLNSTSSQGQTRVTAQFYFGTNIDTAAVDVQEQVAAIASSFPTDPNLSQPRVQKFDSNSLPVVRLFVTDANMTQRDLGDLWTNTLSNNFASVDGVAAVTVNQPTTRAILVEPNTGLLAAYGITLPQISTRIAAENINLPAGIVQVGNNEYQVRSSALLTTAQQVASLVVTTKNGSPVRLGDIANVTDSTSEQRSYERLNGVNAIGVSVNAQPNANIVSTANGVYAQIATIQKQYPGMKFGVVLDQRGFIIEAITALEHTAMLGAFLAILIILLFLHSWRSTLIVALTLPISILGTLFIAYVCGYTLNIMTLGGLALAVGLVVDDAIVVIENIFRHMAHGEGAIKAAQTATAEIFSAVLASSCTVVTVFIPLVLIPGLQGLLFTPFAVMVMGAVALSFVVAVTTVPMLTTVIIGNRPSDHGVTNGKGKGHLYARFVRAFDRGYDAFATWYKKVLENAVDRPGLVALIAIGILAIALTFVKLGFVQTELFPASNSRFVRFNVQMPVGTALNVTNAAMADIEQRMMKDPRVVTIGAQVGSSGPVGGTSITNAGNLSAELAENTTSAQAQLFETQWQSALTGQTVRARGTGAAAASSVGASPNPNSAYGKFRAIAGRPIIGLKLFGRTIDIVQNIIARGQDALDVQIYGPDINTLYDLAQNKVIPALQVIPGLQQPQSGITNSQPELDISINRPLAAQLGLDTNTISQVLDTATAGTTASYMQINGTQYPIVVQLPPDQRRSLEAIENLNVPVASNATGLVVSATPPPSAVADQLPVVPLSEVAQLTFGTGPSEITRQNKQRMIDVSAGLNIPLGTAVTAVGKAMQQVVLPAGYSWQFGPQVQQQSDTFGSLGVIVALAIILVYMLLASQFESFLHPLIIMLSVPLSIAGVVFALIITQRSFGLTAFIGLLMLVGIVVKNAILVVEFTNQLRERGATPREAVLQAAPLRLRPILMTTLATTGGMTPIALGLEAGSETQAPLGTVVIGGLLVSTTLSLIVVPTLYLWASKHLEARMGGFRGHKDIDEEPEASTAPPPGEPVPLPQP